MNYLTNSQFIISDDVKYHNQRFTLSIDEVLKNKKKEKLNSFIATLFKLNDNIEYKNFYIYLSGLKKIINSLLSVFSDVYFTLLIDNSIISNDEILHKIKKIIQENKYHDRIFILYYDNPNIKENGLIGSIVRFLFFFDYENNPFNIIMPCDVDYMDKYILYFLVGYKLLMKNSIDYFFLNDDNLLLLERERNKKIKKYNNIIPYLNNASCECCYSGIMEHKIIDKFINDVMSKEYKYEKYCIIKKERIKYFCYGIDKYFLNNIFIPKLYNSNKRIGTLDIYNYMISSMVYYPVFSFNIIPKEYQLYILNNYNEETIEDYYNEMNIKIYNLIINYLNEINKKYKIFKKVNNTYVLNDNNYKKYNKQLNEEYEKKGLIVSDLLNVLKYENIIMNKMIVIYQKGYLPDYNIIKSIYLNDNDFRTYKGDEFMINNKKQEFDKDYQEIYKIIDDYEKLTKNIYQKTHDKKDKLTLIYNLNENDIIKYINLIKKGKTLRFKRTW